MNTRVNVNIPKGLMKKSAKLIEAGIFSNFSEIIRQGLREQIRKYSAQFLPTSKEEKKLLALLKQMEEDGQFIGEEEAKKFGLEF